MASVMRGSALLAAVRSSKPPAMAAGLSSLAKSSACSGESEYRPVVAS
jgi:hypothetical protein